MLGKGDTGVTGGCSFRECKADGCSGCCIRFGMLSARRAQGMGSELLLFLRETSLSIFIRSLPSKITVDSSTISRSISCQFRSMKNCWHDGVAYLHRVATAVFGLALIRNQCLAQFMSLVSRRSLPIFNAPHTTASTLLAGYASRCLVQPTLFSSPFPITAVLLPFSFLSSKFVDSSKSISKHRPTPKHPVQDSAHDR